MRIRTLAIVLATLVGAAAAAAPAQAARTPFTLTATDGGGRGQVTGQNLGFSVESADFAHGFLTRARMAGWLRTLGRGGVIRLGGYSMDLVWPAFGSAAGTPAPDWAIGGTVEQRDLDQLDALLDASGWRVTLGAPLKSVLDGQVTLEQVVDEVAAAHRTLGRDLVSVELGNEYDHVTTLSAAGYYAELKRYQAAIARRVPGVRLKMSGPSANTSAANARLDEFVAAVLADTSARPQAVLSELTSHWYPGSHCGSSSTSIAALMSAATHTKTQAKLDGIMAIGDRLGGRIPMVINESNSASCSGQAGVSDTYATALWSLDYLMQTAQSGVRRLSFHTSTAALCGRLEPRDSPLYPISYRFYGAFCAPTEQALARDELEPAPLYYGLWAFAQVPRGRFLALDLPDSALGQLRAYAVRSPGRRVTLVLVNVQDPASTASTTDAVTVRLPGRFRRAAVLTLRGTGSGGLASTDRRGPRLGGVRINRYGVPRGALAHRRARTDSRSVTVKVRPGTARIVSLTR